MYVTVLLLFNFRCTSYLKNYVIVVLKGAPPPQVGLIINTQIQNLNCGYGKYVHMLMRVCIYFSHPGDLRFSR